MSEHPKNCLCFMCRTENEPRQPVAVAKSELASPIGSARQARENGMREIRRLCDEAIDHEMGWKSFCEMVKHRLEIETAFVEMASSPNVRHERRGAEPRSLDAVVGHPEQGKT